MRHRKREQQVSRAKRFEFPVPLGQIDLLDQARRTSTSRAEPKTTGAAPSGPPHLYVYAKGNLPWLSPSSGKVRYQGNQEKHQEDDEQDLCDSRRSNGNARKSQDPRDERDNQKNQSPIKHIPPPDSAITPTIRRWGDALYPPKPVFGRHAPCISLQTFLEGAGAGPSQRTGTRLGGVVSSRVCRLVRPASRHNRVKPVAFLRFASFFS